MKNTKARTFLRKFAILMLVLVFLSALVVGLFSIGAKAAGGLEMSTPYPGIAVNPGDSLSFALELDNSTGTAMSAGLSILSMPKGWGGYFAAEGSNVSKVYVGGQTASVTFYLNVPQKAENGTYTVSLQADAGGGASSQLDLELTVTEEATGESSFSVQYPEQEGSAATAFPFSTTLANNYSVEQNYNLSAETPSGWSVTFTPSDGSSQVASLAIQPGQSADLTIDVTPPENAEAGEYAIPCKAAASSETLECELTITITDSYSLSLSTPSETLNFDAQANKESTVTLTLTNNSNVTLDNLTLTSSAPTDWEVRFEPSSVEALEAGATQEVTAYVKPASSAMSGDYVTEITASNSNVSTTTQFRVSVKTSTWWGLVAIIIIILVVLGLVWVFRKYGRR